MRCHVCGKGVIVQEVKDTRYSFCAGCGDVSEYTEVDPCLESIEIAIYRDFLNRFGNVQRDYRNGYIELSAYANKCQRLNEELAAYLRSYWNHGDDISCLWQPSVDVVREILYDQLADTVAAADSEEVTANSNELFDEIDRMETKGFPNSPQTGLPAGVVIGLWRRIEMLKSQSA